MTTVDRAGRVALVVHAASVALVAWMITHPNGGRPETNAHPLLRAQVGPPIFTEHGEYVAY